MGAARGAPLGDHRHEGIQVRVPRCAVRRLSRGSFTRGRYRRHLGMPAARRSVPRQASHSLRRRLGRRSVAGHDRGGRVRPRDLRALRDLGRSGRLVESQAGSRAGIHDPAGCRREAAHRRDGIAPDRLERRLPVPAASAAGRAKPAAVRCAKRSAAGRAKRPAAGRADRRARRQKRGVMSARVSNVRPKPDKVLVDIADYAGEYEIKSAEAYNTARLCLMDTLGCGLEALEYPACTKLLGPIVPGTAVPNGARVPGTRYELDPVQAAFNIGAAIRWLDFNDTWLAAEWGHPSDNLGGILATADWLSRNGTPLVVHDVLTAMIKAHEIQGVIASRTASTASGSITWSW